MIFTRIAIELQNRLFDKVIEACVEFKKTFDFQFFLSFNKGVVILIVGLSRVGFIF